MGDRCRPAVTTTVLGDGPSRTAQRNPDAPRLLIFIVAYNAAKTIREVLTRIPARLAEVYDAEVLVIDDASADTTFDVARTLEADGGLPFKLTVLFNPVNQGYGGNQKIGFHYALEQGFDIVALVHGDGQYAPECLPELAEPLRNGEAEAVFGSRMLTQGAALKGGMPMYKFVGNKVLTTMQNRMLRTALSEFHSGYRLYRTDALRRVPFDLNSNDFHFDTEIIIQLVIAGQRIRELPIPTYYGDEICHVNGLRYAWNVTKAMLLARIQEFGLLYERKYDCARDDSRTQDDLASGHGQYVAKTDFPSPHTAALARIPPNSRVVDLGGASGYLGKALREKGCHVTGVDLYPPGDASAYDAFHEHNLDMPGLPVSLADADVIVMLDVIEHLAQPEMFVERLRQDENLSSHTRLLLSTGNVAFIIVRLFLLFGMFNYGKRGILDLTHKRLFTASTFAKLFTQNGFEIVEAVGIPAPFPLALGKGSRLGGFLLWLNQVLIRIRRSMFAYQIFLEVRKLPGLPELLNAAQRASESRAASSGDSRKAESVQHR
jgi:glycosyltransferase involved in cell wall biosynthesis/2-polyprenyl-3-methyl-5-hydroxy-6-metoxy-1,4-benzoquinol methylase